MLTRNIVLLLSVFVFVVQGELDSNDAGIQAKSTDKDSTSDETPTEGVNAVSPDQPDSSKSSSETVDAPAANQVTAPEPAAAAASSVEENDEDEISESEERGRKRFSSRSAKPQQAHVNAVQNSAPVEQGPVLSAPGLFSQPIIPQPKTQVRSRTSKRRSRTNRRQI